MAFSGEPIEIAAFVKELQKRHIEEKINLCGEEFAKGTLGAIRGTISKKKGETMELVSKTELVDPNEIEIEACDVMPIVAGKAVKHCLRVELSGEKVKITFLDALTGEEKTEEFDAKDVKLSGWLVGS